MIKLDCSAWARQLARQSVRVRRPLAARRRKRAAMVTEGLEERCLLTPLINDDVAAPLPENSPDGTMVYDVNDANTGTDTEQDGDALTYSIIGGDPLGGFAIGAGNGQITVANFRILDFESRPVFTLLVQADDGTEPPDTAVITVNLTNLNENLVVQSASLVDGNLVPILSPFVGEMIGIDMTYTTENLPDPSDYRIEYRIDGIPLSNEGIMNGAGEFMTPPQTWSDFMEGWYATGGQHTVQITLDADNTIAEDNESDNTFTFTFNSATASPPVQFAWPLRGVPQVDEYITAYVDLDPTTDDNTRDDEQDYRGGFHTLDENEGWNISPPTFQDQDLGIPVVAAADGVVVAVNDGEFDRNPAVLDPLPDPIPDANFITIDHGDGYTSTYSYLRQNSVWLRPGDSVVEGQIIGLLGASGPFAFEPALHFEVERYGRPIETLLDPNVYLAVQPDYSGDLNFVRRSFFTQCLPTHPFQPCPNPTNFEESIPYDFRPHMLEGPSAVDYFTVTGNQPVTVFVEFATIRTGDAIEAVWLRPDGSEFARDQVVANREDYSAEFWWRQFMPTQPIQGIWTVEFYQNGAKVGDDSFSVQFEEFADARVERQSIFFPARLDFAEDLYVDERYTPVDLDAPGGGALGFGNQDETWTIHNQGTVPLIIDEILVPAEFDFDVYDKGGTQLFNFPAQPMVIQPGSANYIRVGPQPGLPPGYYSGVVRMRTNDPEEQRYNISVESRVPGPTNPGSLEIGIASRDIFEDPVSEDLVTRLVGNVRRIGDLSEELVVDLVAEVSDVIFPGNVRMAPGEDYASFYIETVNDDKIEGEEILRVGARDRDTLTPFLPAFTTLRIIDDDIAGINIVESAGSTVVDENGSTDTFEVTLQAEPITNVVLNLTTDDPGEAIVGPSTLTFTPLNWNVPQIVTVTGVDDAGTDGDILSNVIVSVNDFLSDNDFDALPDVLVPVLTIDNDVPGFLITESDGSTVVSETGTTDIFDVRLTRQPQSNVLFDVLVGDLGEATVNVGSIVFTPANWDTNQAVVVTGVDDDVVDGTISSAITLTVRDAASDPDWAGVADQSVSVQTLDDEVAGFVIVESDGSTIVSESGTTDTFTVSLVDLPLSDVRLKFTVADPSEVTVSPSTIRFTENNGTTPQTITVTGVDDPFVDGNVLSAITVSVIDAQSQNFFDGLPDQTVVVTTVDDDVAGITVTQTGGTTVVSEDGATDTIQVVLNSQPASDVVLDLVSLDTTEATLSVSQLTFTTGDWSVPRTVAITGPDDTDVDGDITTSVLISVNQPLSDDAYDLVPDQSVNVTNLDNEIAQIVVSETSGSTAVDETGTTDTIFVSLTGLPLSDVVLQIARNDDTEIAVSPTQITFDSSNYNVPVAVTVTGLDDSFVDGTITSAVTISVVDSLSHDAYDPAADRIVMVTTADDEVAGFTVSHTDADTVVLESGTTDQVSVVLDAEPQNDVVLMVAANDTTEATADPLSLTFTPANWNTPQFVTVTGQDDLLADGDILSLVIVSVDDAASDSFFRPLADQSAVVKTVDDDLASFLVIESNGNTLVREGGNTDSVDVVLTSVPLTPVTLNVVSQDPLEVSLTPSSLTFNSTNWDQPQSVLFAAVNDSVEDGKRFTVVDFTVDAASDPMFLGQSAPLTVTSIDNDAPVFLDDTDLIVRGSGLNDLVDLSEAAGTLAVTLNGTLRSFSTADYSRVVVDTKGGDDLVDARTVTSPTFMKAGGGEDTILGGLGPDTVRGGGGNDFISGGDSADFLSGGSGRDLIEGDAGADTIQAGRGPDTVSGGDGSDLIQGNGGKDTLNGNAGADVVGGNESGDFIDGGSGPDTLRGGAGNDTIIGGTGADEITAGSGQDSIDGQADGDLIVAGSGDDTLVGGPGRDVLFGGVGFDRLNGGSDEDVLIAGDTSLSSTHLATILAEWNSGRTYQQRVDNLHDGPAKTSDRVNTKFLIGPSRPSPQTVFDDARRDDLRGEGGNDFFFASIANGDNLFDNTLSEWVDQL